ncbi:MAG: DegV family protein [Clostridia bacterium]|nr:DegV family protein [Clostridia bacterium]
MRKVKIITDSCADLGGELLEKYGIDYVKMSTVYEERETPAYLTWSEEEAHALYDMIRDGKRITTAQVSIDEFRTVFEKYVRDGYDIVYVACASKQTGSVNTGYVVAAQICEQYPDASIFCIDSLNCSIGEGILAIRAAELAAEGREAREIADQINSVRNNVLEYFTVHSLDTLRRSGRVSASAAFFGNLMGIKPIMIADANGAQTPIKKVKGRHAAIKECIALLKENIISPEEQTVYLWHSDCDREELERVKAMILEEIPCKEVRIGYIGPIIGASVGPSVIGVWAFGREVTYIAQ